MNYKQKYQEWIQNVMEKDIHDELCSMNDKQILEAFYKDLEFGTGGLRGIMGAGTNRINKYTIGKATAGLAKYLIDKYGEKAKQKGIVIGFDTRKKSEYFAIVTADVFSSFGIKVYLNRYPRPVSQLSYSVSFFNCIAGVMITASHNPKEYNGYKVYDKYGCQLIPEFASNVMKYVNSINDYKSISFAGNHFLIERIDITDLFVEAVRKQAKYKDIDAKKKLKIVYTPLHGTGNIPITKVLLSEGFESLSKVAIQTIEDGDFPTVKSPNPEDRNALKNGIEQGMGEDADIVLGTDPDCDRVGVAVKSEGEFVSLTGNQVGALLMDYILSNTDLVGKKAAIVKTVVTSELGANIARKKNVAVFDTLTGFKYIGEKITQFELAKLSGDVERSFDFVFGYEESYGYLAGTHARDKDGVVSCLLICEMAAKAKKEGKSIIDKLNEIYEEYGYYLDALDSFTLEGKTGLEKINTIMQDLRGNVSPFENTNLILDYNQDVLSEPFGCLPHSNVLKYFFTDGSWVAIRPSGTEPKIKIYYSIKADGERMADLKLKEYRKVITNKLNL